MPYIDPRLSRHLRDFNPDMLLDAIVIIAADQDPLETWEEDGLAKQVLQQIMSQTYEQPSFLQFIPRANAVALAAKAKFISALLNHPSVQIASSATIDPFLF